VFWTSVVPLENCVRTQSAWKARIPMESMQSCGLMAIRAQKAMHLAGIDKV
jgi:hypothetical protein